MVVSPREEENSGPTLAGLRTLYDVHGPTSPEDASHLVETPLVHPMEWIPTR